MTPRQPEKTLADYAGIAISPFLIMVMIGSLMFFLIEISYEGEYAGRLRWTVFWFVLASVLISRISIEQGATQAGVYGLALAVATGLMLSRFVNFVLGVWCFLALIWWCASKLTWDCTLIQDEEDASGEGLIQVAGLDERAGERERSNDWEGPSSKAVPWWRQLLKNRSERPDQPHAPGLWAVYFSLAALPLFGLGQLLIPQNEPLRRRYGFALLWIYAAATLGLLLTTSFLGLRRYLRQRRLQMPAAMARTWLGLGTALASGVLLFCVLLPRPEAEYSLTALVGKIGSPAGAASGFSLFRDRPGDGDRAQGDTGGLDPGSNGRRELNQESTSGPESGAEGIEGPNPGLSSAMAGLKGIAAWLAQVLRWLIYAVLLGVAMHFLARNWSRLSHAFRELIRDFLNFWGRLFGIGEKQLKLSPQNQDSTHKRPWARSFASYADPFGSGASRRMAIAELVCYTFEALQAWARERGVPRRPEQTPLEFGLTLSRAVPEMDADVRQVTHLYTRAAYSGRPLDEDCADELERIWRWMQSRELVASGPGRLSTIASTDQ